MAALAAVLAGGCGKGSGEDAGTALAETGQVQKEASPAEKEQPQAAGASDKAGGKETAGQPENGQAEASQTPGQGDFAAGEPYAAYEELIAAARECAVNKDSDTMREYDLSTALLTGYNQGTLGYCIEDIDGNGISELVIGERVTDSDGSSYGLIYELDTLCDGEPVRLLKGWERNRYYLCENGRIANEGSSGADDSVYAYYFMEGGELYLEEAVIYDGRQTAVGPWFYSVNSVSAEGAEPISQEEAGRIQAGYIYRDIPLIPFEKMGEGETASPQLPVPAGGFEERKQEM